MAPTGEARRAMDEILGRIVSGAYPAGLRLPSEVDLASELGCGRSTIREALSHLSARGVIRSRRGSGALVLDFRREGTPALLPSYILAGRFDQPASVLARELLGIRSILAVQAVRLAALHGDAKGLAEARSILAKSPSLEGDRAAHTLNELELFRALIASSRVWPAMWLANVFWEPLRELGDMLAPAVGAVPRGYQAEFERLLKRIEARDEAGATAQLTAWLAAIDAGLLRDLELLLGPAFATPTASPSSPKKTAKPTPGPARKKPKVKP